MLHHLHDCGIFGLWAFFIDLKEIGETKPDEYLLSHTSKVTVAKSSNPWPFWGTSGGATTAPARAQRLGCRVKAHWIENSMCNSTWSRYWALFWRFCAILVLSSAACSTMFHILSVDSPQFFHSERKVHARWTERKVRAMDEWWTNDANDGWGWTISDKVIWLVVWNINFIFPYIGNFIIPIDFHIFQRGGPTTNQDKVMHMWRFPKIGVFPNPPRFGDDLVEVNPWWRLGFFSHDLRHPQKIYHWYIMKYQHTPSLSILKYH